MSTWIVQFLIVALFALTCGVLAVAWMRGRLGTAALVLFAVSVLVWIAAFLAITNEFHGANNFATCLDDCADDPLRLRGRVHRPAAHDRPRRSRDADRARPALAHTACARARESRVVASSFKLPDLGEGLTEGEVARWLVAEGQEIAEDDPLVEIQTDKATVEIPSPYGGTVLKVLVAEGDVVPVGTELVVIGTPSEMPPRSSADEPSDTVSQGVVASRLRLRGRAQATPIVRRIAQELGVDLDTVAGAVPAAGSPRTTSVPRRLASTVAASLCAGSAA